MTSNKPYLLRALYDWIIDNGYTPYLLVSVAHGGIDAPEGFAQEGKMVFNLSPKACRGLHIENEKIIFTARFAGEAAQVCLVPAIVLAIYAKENGKGMEFPEEFGPFEAPAKSHYKAKGRPKLALVASIHEPNE